MQSKIVATDQALGTIQPPVQWVNSFSPGIKRLRVDVDHSPVSIADVKDEWNYKSSPLLSLHDTKRKNLNLRY
jgi:hypothetical protein